MGTAIVDAADGGAPFDFTASPAWSILVLHDGRPAARVELPSPGAAGPAFTAAALTRRADAELARRRLLDRLHERLGADPHEAPDTTISVVLCTHRRPQYLPDMLSGLQRLAPAPAEIVVVDNDPGEEDCRAIVEAAGLRYVREDRRGLDNARNAGIRSSTGDIVVFTDDDCVPPSPWLRSLPERFADPSVGGVTGPAFPYVLDTPSRVRMERQAGMTRGFTRMTFDLHTISAVHAGAVGVGANMAFRRSALAELGPEPFPPELDAGQPTESGGDTYVIARMIGAGHRLVYDPEMYTFHQHRPDPRALHRAVRGYGVGISAAMAKLLTHDGELETWRGWWWLVAQYLRTQRRRVVGRADAVETRLSAEYLIGGLRGVGRWRRALAQQRALGPAAPERDAAPEAPAARRRQPATTTGTTAPRISVVIPTHRRPDALARCLDHLAAQTLPAGEFELLVVDDARPATVAPAAIDRRGLHTRLLHSDGGGASAARNLGAREARAPIVLLLDDDIVAAPQLLEAHLARHAARPGGAVVGAYPPGDHTPGLMAASAALWWTDTFQALRTAVAPTFAFLLTGNLSLQRRALLDLGGFDTDIFRREDYEFGMRWLQAGNTITYAPEAAGRHEYTLSSASRVRGTESEGSGDAVMVDRWPEMRGALPLARHRPPASGSPVRRLAMGLLERPAAQRATIAVLELLEAGKLRMPWVRGMVLAQRAAYSQGLYRAGYVHPDMPEELLLDCELTSAAPLTFDGAVAPTLRVTLEGRELGRVRPRDALWGAHVAEQIAELVGHAEIERAGRATGWLPACDAESVAATLTVVEPGDATAPAAFWAQVSAAAATAMTDVLAVRLPGAGADERWAGEALTAFDAEGVDVAFGAPADDGLPVQPLFVHDRAAPPAFAVGHVPAYVMVRRSALERLGGVPVAAARHGHLGPAMALIRAALDAGGLVARRDVHGLGAPAAPPADQGRAWAAAQLDGAPAAALAKGAAAVAATVLWSAYKRRGRPDAALVAGAAGAARGALDVLRRR
jgi:glycosyltransferase involved in cell wall biosynthesis